MGLRSVIVDGVFREGERYERGKEERDPSDENAESLVSNAVLIETDGHDLG